MLCYASHARIYSRCISLLDWMCSINFSGNFLQPRFLKSEECCNLMCVSLNASKKCQVSRDFINIFLCFATEIFTSFTQFNKMKKVLAIYAIKSPQICKLMVFISYKFPCSFTLIEWLISPLLESRLVHRMCFGFHVIFLCCSGIFLLLWQENS